MRKELEVFENRNEDWLASQRKAESGVSVWDFDEARKIKEDHARRHSATRQIEAAPNQQYRLRQPVKQTQNTPTATKFVGKIVTAFIIFYILIVVMIIFGSAFGF